MNVTVKNSLDIILDNAGVSKILIDDTLLGGSGDEFFPEDGDDIDPTGDEFEINDYEQKVFNLTSSTTFDQDIITLLKTPAANITGILIKAGYCDEGKTNVPVRFNVGIKLTTMSSPVDMGSMSNFSLMNILGNKIEQLEISELVIPEDKEANLIIVVFSNNANE